MTGTTGEVSNDRTVYLEAMDYESIQIHLAFLGLYLLLERDLIK